MSRPTLLIASRHSSIAAALHQYIDLFLPYEELIHQVKHIGFSCSAELFEEIDKLVPEQLRETMVLFDISAEGTDTLDVQNLGREHGLAAQLVLSYPEIYFVFFSFSGFFIAPVQIGRFSEWDIVKQHHFILDGCLTKALKLVQLHAQGFRTIFDATGLRSYLKSNLQELILKRVPGVYAWIYQPYSEERIKQTAAVADEEAAFLYLNGYAAYKFGCRAWLAHTEKEFSRLLGINSEDNYEIKSPQQFAIAVADWHLAYRDDEDPNQNKSLIIRKNAFRAEKVGQPIVVTSFPHELKGYLKGYKDKHAAEDKDGLQKAIILQKPYGGFFDFRESCREKKILQFELKIPRLKNEPAQEQDPLPLHSAPHACSIVATRLLSRARRMKTDNSAESESWIQIAILANEAKEILGALSRTTAYEAIALQNEAEVRAEVSFFGTSAKIEVKERLQRLQEEVEKVQQASRGLDKGDQREDEESRLNCLLQTVNNLRLQFSEYEQIEAAEECLVRFAEYDRKLKSGKGGKLYRLGEYYVDYATNAGTSVWRLLTLSLQWAAVFWIIYFALFQFHRDTNHTWIYRLPLAMWHSLYTFVELQPGLSEVEDLITKQKDYWIWVNLYRLTVFLEVAIAYLHLGLLVSVLYRRITRRAP